MSRFEKMQERVASPEYRFLKAIGDAHNSLSWLQDIGMSHGKNGTKFLRQQAIFLRNHIAEIESLVAELPDYTAE